MAATVSAKGAKSDKVWRQAIMLAVNREVKVGKKRTKYLDILAMRIVKLAGDGDISALREVGDRLDGRPAAEITGPDGDMLTVRFVIEGK